MSARTLYRTYEGSGHSWLEAPPSSELVYRSDEGIAWKCGRETGRHLVTVPLMTFMVAAIITAIHMLGLHPVAYLVALIPVLMLAGETADLIIWSRGGLGPEVHVDGLWYPSVAYNVISWHVVPFAEMSNVRRSGQDLVVSTREGKMAHRVDIRWLGEEGARLALEGARGALQRGAVPRLVVYDRASRHDGSDAREDHSG